eukprot:Gregarina_sp_Pseudo_9__1390@NODE_192_length_3688_cov_29_771718_g177_i0_p6_GENE_NODE_192_length_3688_cov_29_771718_g177_i0NODE_192_length_3688_cov_29_771718_g177_i0_p6_ORF_typecomplete_len102_score3_90Clat_adaptor_s/PF01217_20/0_0075MtlR/PF05068_12/0_0083YtzH/PF14165_6/0_024_NODE_192_length_3688_cov_29_771718_g177_i030335
MFTDIFKNMRNFMAFEGGECSIESKKIVHPCEQLQYTKNNCQQMNRVVDEMLVGGIIIESHLSTILQILSAEETKFMESENGLRSIKFATKSFFKMLGDFP